MKKLNLLLLMILFLFLPAFVFGRELETRWPNIPGIITPEIGVSLEELAVYIYHFSLIVGGLSALVILIYAGFLYLTSFGNPKLISEAKQRTISSFLGLLLLFSSYLILRTIDPELTVPRIELREEEIVLPPAVKVEIEPVMPKSYTQLTTFEQSTKNTIDFLNQKITEFNDLELPERIQATLGLIENAPTIDCSNAITICSKPCLVPISCRWPIVPSIISKTDFNKENPLPKLEQIIEETVESSQAKILTGDLRVLSNCLLEGGRDVLINSQAEQENFLDHFNIINRYPLYFYCFTR